MTELKEVYWTEYKTRGVTYEIRKHASMTQKIKESGVGKSTTYHLKQQRNSCLNFKLTVKDTN